MSGPCPVVGLSASDQHVRYGAWDTTATLVPAAYVRMVELAGGIPVLLPPPAEPAGERAAGAPARDRPGGDFVGRRAAEHAARVVERLDAVVLTGGTDVDPALYGEDPHERTQPADPARDAFELALVAACEERDLPLLGICRGLQLLNVARGGSLVQHLADAGESAHLDSPGRFSHHPVRLEEGSAVDSVYGPRGVREQVVACHHHQGVARLGRGLVVTATGGDGVVEALEAPGSRFVVAVQWHPEADGDPSLFEALVAAAASQASPARGGPRT